MASKERNKEISGSDEEKFEEMKQRLTEVGLYETGISLDQMKDIINVLDESTKNAEKNNVHQIPQERTSSLSSPIDGIENVSPPETPSENTTETPKVSYSNVTRNSKSPTVNVAHERRESTEGNSASESNDRKSPKESAPTPKPASNDFERKQQRNKKLNMDPLKVILNENDKPLQQPERTLVIECEPFSLCNDLKNSTFTPQELVQKMSDYLQEVRDEWIAQNISESDKLDFQWGSPIKVDSRNFNSDRKSVTRNEQEVVEPVRESRSRASKRKAASIIAKINKFSDSDPESDDESTLLKKRKSEQERRTATTSGSDVQMDVDEFEEVFEMPSTSSSHFSNQVEKQDSDDEDIFEFRVKSKSPEPFQPRRIVPPVPGTNKARRGKTRGATTNFKGPRAKKFTENAKKTLESEKKSLPPEIVLDNDDVEFEDLSKSPDLKVLKLPLSETMKLATQTLADKNIKEKQLVEQKKLQDNMLEEETRKAREKTMKKRLEEEEKAKRLAREKEEKENEKKKMWNKVLNDSVKQKKEKTKGLSDEDIRMQLDQEEVVVCDDQSPVHAIDSTSENQVPCPICNRFYPESEIQNHASGCNQFEDSTQDTLSSVTGSRRRISNGMLKLKCNICDDYETFSDSDYMEHVEICIEENRVQESSTR